MKIAYKPMTSADYNAVRNLWEKAGLSVSEADSFENISRYLQRNPDFCLVAKSQEGIVGAILCGHDGRRAHINHLVVSGKYRREGIATKLVELCVDKLKAEKVGLVYLSVIKSNFAPSIFWNKMSWVTYDEMYPSVELLCRKI